MIESKDKKVFLCVRDPITWLHSLWHHRARKKGLFGLRRFNWNKEYLIEKSGNKSNNFESFIKNVIELDNPMMDYYEKFFPNIDELHLIYFENLANSLVSFLKFADEEFSENEILKFENIGINSTNRLKGKNKISNSFKLKENDLNKLIKNNKRFFELTKYSYDQNNIKSPEGFVTVDINKYFMDQKTLGKNKNYLDFLTPIIFSTKKITFL